MMTLNSVLQKLTWSDKIYKITRKDYSIGKKWKRTRKSDINNKNIQPGQRNGIWHSKTCYAHNEEEEKTNSGRKRTNKSGKNQNAWREGKALENIRSGYHQIYIYIY